MPKINSDMGHGIHYTRETKSKTVQINVMKDQQFTIVENGTNKTEPPLIYPKNSNIKVVRQQNLTE